MRGELHPIYDIGIENLVAKLIERGEKEKKHGECEVTFTPGAKINGRVSTVLRVVHPTQRPHFECHKTEIFFDEQTKIPVRYAAYSWPQKAGEEPPLLVEYTCLNVKLGLTGSPLLTDADFDPENPNYCLTRPIGRVRPSLSIWPSISSQTRCRSCSARRVSSFVQPNHSRGGRTANRIMN